VGRHPVPAVVRHSATLAWRGVLKTVHSTEALLDVTLQPLIFLLLFVYVFGGAIAGDTSTYLQYALPGVLVQTVVFASAGTGTGLADDLKTGIFDRFRSLPISRTAPLLGAIGADLVRYVTSLLQPVRGRSGEGQPPHVGQGRSTPQAGRLGEQGPGLGGLGAAGLRDERPEPQRVDLLRVDGQAVAAGGPLDEIRAQRPAQP
jgi:hypothetical protein